MAHAGFGEGAGDAAVAAGACGGAYVAFLTRMIDRFGVGVPAAWAEANVLADPDASTEAARMRMRLGSRNIDDQTIVGRRARCRVMYVLQLEGCFPRGLKPGSPLLGYLCTG